MLECSCEMMPGVGDITKVCGAHAEVVLRAVEAERAACAAACEIYAERVGTEWPHAVIAAQHLADHIRSRAEGLPTPEEK